MTKIKDCIINKETTYKPIWLMRQAGRYLPEFREIRKKNQNFINLCLNDKLSSEITLQPLRRFNFDAAIIFSDILMLPYGLGQSVEFKKNFGPLLGDLNIEKLSKVNESKFINELNPIYKTISIVKKNEILRNKDLIGFVGAPWTLLVYMLNKQSPKKDINKKYFNDKSLIENLLNIIDKFLKIHIKNQIESGATIIQIFDSWAGLVEEENIEKYIYEPTRRIVKFVKDQNVPVICFPRNIKSYKNYVDIVIPSAINIDYNVDPLKIRKEIKIPVQGGLDPKILLSDKKTLKKEVQKYLELFKDHPYIFNLGHGILPETKIEMVEELVNIIKNFK